MLYKSRCTGHCQERYRIPGSHESVNMFACMHKGSHGTLAPSHACMLARSIRASSALYTLGTVLKCNAQASRTVAGKR